MSKSLFTPVNQIRLTNVAIVRLKKGGKRFEIACYPNKVQQYRDKIETDLSEVLQVDKIFINVSKGQIARKEDLEKAFGSDDEKKAVEQILQKGEIQVSGKERDLMHDKMFKDIATIIAEKCVDPETKRPLTVSLLERAMKDIHYSVNQARNTKQQALDVIKLLKDKIPIERAQMRLKISLHAIDGKEIKEELQTKQLIHIEKEDIMEDQLIIDCQIDPSNFRSVNELVTKNKQTKGKIELLNLAVQQQGEQKME